MGAGAASNQPLTACVDGAIGDAHHQINRQNSDVLTFHMYEADQLEACIEALKGEGGLLSALNIWRAGTAPVSLLAYRFSRSTMSAALIGAWWQAKPNPFDWETILQRGERVKAEQFLAAGEALPEPDLWHHDILRIDGSAYIAEETDAS